MQKQEDINCVVLGLNGVGKTSLINKFIPNGASEDQNGRQIYKTSWLYEDTLYNIKVIEVSFDKLKEDCSFFDTTHLFALIYDVTNQISFDLLKDLIENLVDGKWFKTLKAIVVGNKCDLLERVISFEEAEKVAKKIGLYLELSNGKNIDREQLFQTILNSQCSLPSTNQPKGKAAPPQIMQDSWFAAPSSAQLAKYDASIQIAKLTNAIVIGSLCTGKTQFSLQLASESFKQNYEATIGVDFKTLCTKWGGKQYRFHVWQTSGDQKFQVIATAYYRQAEIVFIFYDITNIESFQKVLYYRNQVSKHSFVQERIKIALIGNKSDLSSNRKITFEEGAKLAQSFGALFFEISCKQKEQSQECFLKTVQYFLTFNQK